MHQYRIVTDTPQRDRLITIAFFTDHKHYERLGFGRASFEHTYELELFPDDLPTLKPKIYRDLIQKMQDNPSCFVVAFRKRIDHGRSTYGIITYPHFPGEDLYPHGHNYNHASYRRELPYVQIGRRNERVTDFKETVKIGHHYQWRLPYESFPNHPFSSNSDLVSNASTPKYLDPIQPDLQRRRQTHRVTTYHLAHYPESATYYRCAGAPYVGYFPVQVIPVVPLFDHQSVRWPDVNDPTLYSPPANTKRSYQPAPAYTRHCVQPTFREACQSPTLYTRGREAHDPFRSLDRELQSLRAHNEQGVRSRELGESTRGMTFAYEGHRHNLDSHSRAGSASPTPTVDSLESTTAYVPRAVKVRLERKSF